MIPQEYSSIRNSGKGAAMRHLVVIVMMLGVVGFADGFELGNQVPDKGDAHVNPQEGVNPRQGGDTIADATPIASVPFSDSGTTAGYANDYDEVCPYPGSTAPDVVYSFTPDEQILVEVDLCGSDYDTKIYIYDAGLNLVACNDDFYYDDVCGVFVSKLVNVTLMAGSTYYLVIDGYGEEFGDYHLEIEEYIPCVLECPDSAALEGEPPLMDGYVDNYNGGCNTSDVDPLSYVQTVQSGDLCGVSGWFDDGMRDTDWFVITLNEFGYVTWTCDAEQATYMIEVLYMPDCANVTGGLFVIAGPCLPANLTIYGAPGSDVFLFTGPTVYYPPHGFIGHEYDYICHFDIGVVATEDATWSQLKAMYR